MYFSSERGNTALNLWSILECVSHEILMNRFQHVHFLYFQVFYSSQQADIDFEKMWQQRQQYMIKSSIVYAMSLISVIYAFLLYVFKRNWHLKLAYPVLIQVMILVITHYLSS